MHEIAFTFNGTALSPLKINELDKYDLLKAFFETVNNCQKAGHTSQHSYFFAIECVNSAAAVAGKSPPLKIDLNR